MSQVASVPSGADVNEKSLALLVERLTARLQHGEAVDLSAEMRAQPEHAEQLALMWPALAALADLARSGSAAAGAEGDEPLGELGDFRILREVGRGGMGMVYEALQTSLRRRVALKVLPFAATMDPRQLQRFHNEALAAASLHHTNIVPVYFVGCERGVHFYAMQFIEGRDLASVIVHLREQSGGKQSDPNAAQPVAANAGEQVRTVDTPPLAGLSTKPGRDPPRISAPWHGWASRRRRRWITRTRWALSTATSSPGT